MAITSNVLEAYLKCPTKCWLRSADEKATDSLRTHYARVPDESITLRPRFTDCSRQRTRATA